MVVRSELPTFTIDSIQIKRSFTPGALPTSLLRGEEFVNVVDGFRLIGDGVTAPAQLPRIAFKPADQLPISQEVASALNGKANASDLAALSQLSQGKLDKTGDGSQLTGVIHPADLPAALTALIAALPTTLPSQPGQLWNNGGIIQIS